MHNRLRNKRITKKAVQYDNGGFAGIWGKNSIDENKVAGYLAKANEGIAKKNSELPIGKKITPFGNVDEYLDDTNWLGISKRNNPFSKVNIGNTLNKGFQVGANIGGNIAKNAIANKHQATGVAGGVLTGMDMASDAAIASGNPLAVALGLAGKGTVGLGHRFLGNNQEALAEYDDTIGTMNNFYVSGDNNDIQRAVNMLPTNTNIKRSDFGVLKGGDYRNYRTQMDNAIAFANNSIGNAIYNNQHNLLSEMYNYDNSVRQSAFGGPLDGPIGYDFMQSYLRNGYLNATKNDRITSMPNSFSMPNTFAFGGNVETGGNTYSTKVTHVDAGGTHEDNPNGGVNVGYSEDGDLNQVEEDEVIYNDYVFSNRLKVPFGPHSKHRKRPKKGDKSYEELFLFPYEDMTYADAAKKIEKKIFGEKGDAMRFDKMQEDQLAHDLQILQDSQEAVRAEKQQKELEKFLNSLSPKELIALQQNIEASQQQNAVPQAATQIPEGYDVNNQMIDPYAQMPIADAQMAYAAYGGKLFADGGKLNAKEIDAQLAQIEQYAVANNNRELLDSINKTKNLNLRKKKQFIDKFNKNTQQQNIQVEQPVEQEENVEQYSNSGNVIKHAEGDWLKNLTPLQNSNYPITWNLQNWYNAQLGNPWISTKGNADGTYKYFTLNDSDTEGGYRSNLEAFRRAILGENYLGEQNTKNYPEKPSEVAEAFFKMYDASLPKESIERDAFYHNGKLRDDWAQHYDHISGDKMIAQGHNVMTGNIDKYYYVTPEGNKVYVQAPTNLASYRVRDYDPIQDGIITTREHELLGLLNENPEQPTPMTPQDAVELEAAKAAETNSEIATKVVNPQNGEEGIRNPWNNNPYPLPSKNPYRASLLAAILQGGNALLSGPDLTAYRGLLNASRRAGNYMSISPEIISNPYRYTPFDQVLLANNVNNAAANSRRALANNAGLNRGNAAANILMSDYNILGNLGEAQAQGLNTNEQNYLNYAKGTESIDSFNANSRNTIAQANQSALANASARQNALLGSAYDARQAAIDRRDKAISDAISLGLNSYKSIYDTDYANAQTKWLFGQRYMPGYTGVDSDFITIGGQRYVKAPSANGGKLKRKNNRKSLL